MFSLLYTGNDLYVNIQLLKTKFTKNITRYIIVYCWKDRRSKQCTSRDINNAPLAARILMYSNGCLITDILNQTEIFSHFLRNE